MPLQPNRPTDDVWSAPESGTIPDTSAAQPGTAPAGKTNDGSVSIRVPASPGEGITEEQTRRNEATST
jgi:hypothetical protein